MHCKIAFLTAAFLLSTKIQAIQAIQTIVRIPVFSIHGNHVHDDPFAFDRPKPLADHHVVLTQESALCSAFGLGNYMSDLPIPPRVPSLFQAPVVAQALVVFHDRGEHRPVNCYWLAGIHTIQQ